MITDEQLELILRNDSLVDVTKEVNDIWKCANIMRGTLTEDKYKDGVLPLFLIRRIECTLEDNRDLVHTMYETNPDIAPNALESMSGHCYYNTSEWTLEKLLTDQLNLTDNLRYYIQHFSNNVQNILSKFAFDTIIDTLHEAGRLYPLIKAFSEFDYSPKTMDSIKCGYVLEELLRRFGTQIMTGEHYTAREIIELMVALGLAEGMDDVLNNPGKVVSILDLACGTGGMLSTAHSAIFRCNPKAKFNICGQELNPESYAICSMEMMLRGLDDAQIVNGNSLMKDPFEKTEFRLVLENPPFGVPWKGDEAPLGSEDAVVAERLKGTDGRFPGGLPGGGDSQMLFLQMAMTDLADNGRAVIVSNSSPLVTGGTSSGESQIRRYLLENDYIEAVIKLPGSLFYNTSLNTFLWVMSKNKKSRRKGKVQLINAENLFHKLRKAMGEKRNELAYEDKLAIVKEYLNFKKTEISQIHDTTEFIYREYTVRQPLKRNYMITDERLKEMGEAGTLNSIYNKAKHAELLAKEKKTAADEEKLAKFDDGHSKLLGILTCLALETDNEKVWYSQDEFTAVLDDVLSKIPSGHKVSKAEKIKIAKALSHIDKSAPEQRDPKTGDVLMDEETKDIEVIKGNEDVDEYMAREVVPYVPDAHWSFEEDLTKKNPVIKTGAEIPFERCFYVYEKPEPPEEIAKRIQDLDRQADALMRELFGDGE